MGWKEKFPCSGMESLTHVYGYRIRKSYTTNRFTFLDKKDTCSGYEIHMGKTSLLPNVADSPLLQTEDGRTDGYLQDNHC